MQLSNKKIRVFLLGQDNIGWSIDSDRKNITNLLASSCDFEITPNIFKADIIYSVWYNILERPWYFYPILLLKKINQIKVFAVITNQIENTPEKVLHLTKIVDIWISPSIKTHNFIKQKHLSSVHIPFIVDKQVFHTLSEPKDKLAKKLDIPYSKISGKILIGSFQRDSLGSDLSKSKWQKNPDLLIEILKKLPKEKILLILAGPRRHYIINKCKKIGVPYLFVGNEKMITKNKDDVIENNLSLEKINLLYNLVDIYLVTSKSEGGPKAPLEAALTKTLIFSTDVGLIRDALHKDLIFSEDNLKNLINKLSDFISNPNYFNDKISYNFKNVTSLLNEKKILMEIKNSYEN